MLQRDATRDALAVAFIEALVQLQTRAPEMDPLGVGGGRLAKWLRGSDQDERFMNVRAAFFDGLAANIQRAAR